MTRFGGESTMVGRLAVLFGGHYAGGLVVKARFLLPRLFAWVRLLSLTTLPEGGKQKRGTIPLTE